MKTIVAGAVIAVLVSGAISCHRSDARSLTAVKTVAFTGPSKPTAEQVSAFNTAVARNDPLPDGWQVTGNEGTVNVVDTGIVLASGERSWVVTVLDDRADLTQATVFVDGAAVQTVTRRGGGIVDHGESSVATLPVLVPPADRSWKGRVEWAADDGTLRHVEGIVKH